MGHSFNLFRFDVAIGAAAISLLFRAKQPFMIKLLATKAFYAE